MAVTTQMEKVIVDGWSFDILASDGQIHQTATQIIVRLSGLFMSLYLSDCYRNLAYTTIHFNFCQ